MRNLILAVMAAVFLAGCGKFYWNKPGATEPDFAQAHRVCTQEVGIATAAKDYVLVPKKFYHACMQARGWTRTQQVQPPPAGWFRGIESDEIVRLDAPPPAEVPPAAR